MTNKFKQDKGTAGLTILLSVVVMLFVIGLLIMIFSLMGTSLRDSTYTPTSTSAVNDTLVTVTETGEDFSVASYRNVVCGVVTNVVNVSGYAITSGNYTQTNCNIKTISATTVGNNTNWKVSYSYTYDADNTATNVMNDTTTSIATTTQWFDIFVVIGAMVVLILLTVIIITAIRSSGMVGGVTTGANKVGTA